jgi:hypothetical protein
VPHFAAKLLRCDARRLSQNRNVLRKVAAPAKTVEEGVEKQWTGWGRVRATRSACCFYIAFHNRVLWTKL